MTTIILSTCNSDNPLSEQLTESIPGFKWRRDQYSPLVNEITTGFMQYQFMGSMEVDNGTCGFCGKTGITTEYRFVSPSPSITVHGRFKNELYSIVLPQVLTTGSKCKEFPRVAEFVRENLNNVFRGVQYDGTNRWSLLKLANATIHPKADPNMLKYKMLHIPLDYISINDRYPLMHTLCCEYEYFVFAKRKTLPKDTKAVHLSVTQ